MHSPFPEPLLEPLPAPLPAPLSEHRRDALVDAGFTVVDDAASAGGVLAVRDGRRSTIVVVALPDDAVRARCAEHLARWRQVDDPGIEQLVDAVDLGDGVALLRPLTGPSLAEFVERQGPLSAGQASTVLVDLGRTLARLHADGTHYGPMTADDVLVVDGRPRLVVPATAPLARAALPPSPAEDAYHLAALADSVIAPSYGPGAPALAGAALRALNRTIVTALGDAASRPGVGTLASLSHDIAACQPLVLLEPSPDVTTVDADAASGRRVRRPSRALLASCALGVVLVAAGTWWLGAGALGDRVEDGDTEQTGVAAGPTIDGPADGPAAAAADLTVRRFGLLTRMTASEPDVDAREWETITLVGSPAHAQALELVAALVAEGSSLTGLAATVESATLVEGDATSARVEVVYSTSEYAVRTVSGSSVVPPGGPQVAVLTLVRVEGRWLVSDVSETTPTAGPGTVTDDTDDTDQAAVTGARDAGSGRAAPAAS